MILVTGGAGFIGSNFVLRWITEEKSNVVNFDKLTSAGNLNNLSRIAHANSHDFVQGNRRNRSLLNETLKKYQPVAVVHCAAETSTDRVLNTRNNSSRQISPDLQLLEDTYAYWKQLDPEQKKRFRFLHLSTDEVYGPSYIMPRRQMSLPRSSHPPFTQPQKLLPTTSFKPMPIPMDSPPLLHASPNFWPLPISGQINSPHHRQCPPRKTPSGLWRRPRQALVAVCLGPLQRTTHRLDARLARRNL